MTNIHRIGRGTPALLASCLALSLAACGAFDTLNAPPPSQTAAPASEPLLPPPPPRKPTPPGIAVARLPPPSAPVDTPSADRLIGLDQPQVASLLGEPRTRAESPPATIWRYRGPDCEVDVYFYLDLQSQAMRALHYEVRSHDGPEPTAQRCYDALVNERRAHAESTAGSDRPR